MKPTAVALVSVLALTLAAFGQHAPATMAQPAYQVEFFLSSQKGTAAPVTHDYTLRLLAESGSASVSTGDKVPISTGDRQFTYQSIGVELTCDIMKQPAPPGQVPLFVRVSVSGVAAHGAASDSGEPTISTVSSHLATQVPIGRKEAIASFDDATTHTHYQLAVIVTSAS